MILDCEKISVLKLRQLFEDFKKKELKKIFFATKSLDFYIFYY